MIYQPGLLVGQLSGKAGHTVASKNAYATTIGVARGRPAARSQSAQLARQSFKSIAAAFKSLGPTDLSDWAALGSGISVTGRLSREFVLSAQAAFQYINRNLHTTGQAYVTTAPTVAYPDPINSFTADAQAEPTGPFEINLTIDPATVPADTYFAVYAQVARDTVASTFGLKTWKLMEVLAPGDSTAIDIHAPYTDAFSRWWPGQTIPLKVVALSSVGFRGLPLVTWVTSS